MARLRAIPFWQRYSARLGVLVIGFGAAIFAFGAHTLYTTTLAATAEPEGILQWDPYGLGRFAFGISFALYGAGRVAAGRQPTRREEFPSQPPKVGGVVAFFAISALIGLVFAAGLSVMSSRFRETAEGGVAAETHDPGWPAWDTYGFLRIAVGGIGLTVLASIPISQSYLSKLGPMLARRLSTDARRAAAFYLLIDLLLFLTMAALPAFLGMPKGWPMRPNDLDEQIRQAREVQTQVSARASSGDGQSRAAANAELAAATADLRRLLDMVEKSQEMPRWLWIMGPAGVYGVTWDLLRVAFVICTLTVIAFVVKSLREK